MIGNKGLFIVCCCSHCFIRVLNLVLALLFSTLCPSFAIILMGKRELNCLPDDL